MTTDYKTQAAEARAKAAKCAQDAQESFDRCDTDGFLSQWASDRMSSHHRLEASIADNNGLAEFPALTDLDGNLVPARMVDTRYGSKFVVFANAEDANTYNAPVVAWVDPWVKTKTLARKGYRLAYVERPARAEMKGTNAVNVRSFAVPDDGIGFDPTWKVVAFYEGE